MKHRLAPPVRTTLTHSFFSTRRRAPLPPLPGPRPRAAVDRQAPPMADRAAFPASGNSRGRRGRGSPRLHGPHRNRGSSFRVDPSRNPSLGNLRGGCHTKTVNSRTSFGMNDRNEDDFANPCPRLGASANRRCTHRPHSRLQTSQPPSPGKRQRHCVTQRAPAASPNLVGGNVNAASRRCRGTICG
jgi:hypothetical protein